MVQTTLKQFIEHSQQYLNDPVSTLILILKTSCIRKEQYKIEKNGLNI